MDGPAARGACWRGIVPWLSGRSRTAARDAARDLYLSHASPWPIILAPGINKSETHSFLACGGKELGSGLANPRIFHIWRDRRQAGG